MYDKQELSLNPFPFAGLSSGISVKYDYDLIVIGGGSGGLACSKEGWCNIQHHEKCSFQPAISILKYNMHILFHHAGFCYNSVFLLRYFSTSQLLSSERKWLF